MRSILGRACRWEASCVWKLEGQAARAPMLSGHMPGGAHGILSLLTVVFVLPEVSGLQCYGCNIIVGTKYVDTGCSNPEVITCSHSHQGFKHRFCIKTESVVLGILLTSGCATSRHCQQQELPGVRIHCCDTDLCNGSPQPPPSLAGGCLLLPSLLAALLLS
ncbi:ly6/PLAUR domain-containing protein 1-like [Phasianus colchicus]|uniref:ly6/PLAUR domain-containing protein 1-like n=2 Tax=Phasianidae TaxID=9005 RepID=UPI00129DBA9F|nr:ly6/PLAUR domain-containing protein 1-like [Phasianus colchicus]